MTANNEADEIERLKLYSVLRREKDVFASNRAGLFRAELSEKSWKQLPVPDSLPIPGGFVKQMRPLWLAGTFAAHFEVPPCQ